MQPVDKVQRAYWNRELDTLFVAVEPSKLFRSGEEKLTTRMILSQIAELYDIFGFAAPVTIKANIGLQELWRRQYGWNEDLPSEIKTFLTDWQQDLEALKSIRFDRCQNSHPKIR